MLKTAFDPYGTVTNVKVIRDKGGEYSQSKESTPLPGFLTALCEWSLWFVLFLVAYVKFDKASCAADAMENLNGAVLNNGRGPKLKVLLAESPNQR